MLQPAAKNTSRVAAAQNILKRLMMAEYCSLVELSFENFVPVSQILAFGGSAVPAVKHAMQLGHLRMT